MKHEPFPNNYRANLKPLETDKIADSGFVNNSGTIPAFSNVPYLTATFECTAYANQLLLTNLSQINRGGVPPIREENDIKEFSPESRKRLFDLITSIDYKSYGKPLFVSATWHEDFHNNLSDIKTHLDNFHKRLKRNLPPFHLIWKLEYQKRGAPHFHFVLFPLDSSHDFNTILIGQIISHHWIDLKECKCKDCKLYSVKILPLNNFIHTMIYISKELGKVTQNSQKHNLGRIWGSSRNMRIRIFKTFQLEFKMLSKMLQEICDQNSENKNLVTFVQAIRSFGFSSKVFIPWEQIQTLLIKYSSQNLLSTKKMKSITMKRYNFRSE